MSPTYADNTSKHTWPEVRDDGKILDDFPGPSDMLRRLLLTTRNHKKKMAKLLKMKSSCTVFSKFNFDNTYSKF